MSATPPADLASATPARGAPPDPRPALNTPLRSLQGVGLRRSTALHKLGLRTLGDLLDYLPRDYRFESSERPVDQLIHEQIQTVRGHVIATDYIPGRPRSRFEATMLDVGSGEKLALVWFNSPWMRTKLRPGMLVRVRGKVRRFRNLPQMANPNWEEVDEQTQAIAHDTFRPVYRASADVVSDQIAALIRENLPAALEHVDDILPEPLRRKRSLVSRSEAYRRLHTPADAADALEGRRRLVYDELLLLQLGLGVGRRLREGSITAPALRVDRVLDRRIRSRFPFELTDAQQRCVWEIVHDLKGGVPMNRLLQGDVGSGKTVVALYGMLAAVANRLQAVMLAPTEVLAAQHFLTLRSFLEGSSVRLEMITARTKRGGKSALLERLAEGEIDIAVGTQALLRPEIRFANLGLVVVDEQHKLGVRQRAFLRERGRAPHYLVMTATPIPRTLALSYLADFDVSTIDALPPGRQPVETRHLRQQQREQAYRFLRRQIEAGRQAYVVLPQIEEDDLNESASVKRLFADLAAGPLAGLRLAMLHGQLSTAEKEQVMSAFRAGEVDVLVATTVIEVGVDVANATVMVVENAERFGLSQLHQLRGRVGRGSEKSYCLLVSDPPTSAASERLAAMVRTGDGFELAEVDLKLRGPGDFFGTRQHGLPSLKVANLTEEMHLLKQAREDALRLLAEDPHLSRPEHHQLRLALLDQYGDTLELALVG